MPIQKGRNKRFILSVGELPELLSLREKVLRSCGYEVFTTTHPHQADQRITSRDCGVLLMCYSVSEDWRQQLIRNFRAHCPQGRIVAITNRQVNETPKNVDALVYGVEGPEVLVDAIEGKAAA